MRYRYVGTNPLLESYNSKRLVVGLLGVEPGQDAADCTEMYQMEDMIVLPYMYTIADFSMAISNLRNNLSHALVDEGLVVSEYLGPEMKVTGNILAGDRNSLAYARNPGAFYPHGAQGVIESSYLRQK